MLKLFFVKKILTGWGRTMTEAKTLFVLFFSGSCSLALNLSSKSHHMTTFICSKYSIVKDSSADLGVNFKIVQYRPTVQAVCTKISNFFFLHICQYFYISEKK
jgi:hypothetical protein